MLVRRPTELGWLLVLWVLAGHPGDLDAGWPVKLARQPGNVLSDFMAYRHISIVHFDVPENAVLVGFRFVTKEDKISGIGECSGRNVTINLKSGSLPLVRPDGSKIGARLLEPRRRHYTLTALSDGDENQVNIAAPPPGDWYVVAYRSWHDPDNGKISQQGLSVNCDTILDAELWVEYADTIHRAGESEYTSQLKKVGDSSIMHFRVPEKSADRLVLGVRSTCGESCVVSLHVTAGDHLLGRRINASETSVEFQPYEDDSVHYVTLRLDSGVPSNLTVSLRERQEPEKLAEVGLTRKTAADFFRFDYEHLVGNNSKPVPMNLTAGATSVMRFKVGAVYDTGGILFVGLKIADDKSTKTEKEKVILVGCVTYGHHSAISHPGNCGYDVNGNNNNTGKPADLLVTNSTSPDSIHVPYPEPGIWHLSVRAYCVNESGGCECFEECARGNSSSSCEGCDCARDCDARAEIDIGSESCVEEDEGAICNNHGQCVHYMSGGFVFSACNCYGDYRGFDCADDEYVLSQAKVWTRLLLLTLSNLAFIGAIFVALRRGYHTEAVVYTAVMFFSTFYHACEGGDEAHSFCLIKLNVLQFCDFFNALLSIWVTLVAMASLGPRATSFCQMLGVVVLAVGAELDRTALWVFLLPTVCGLVLVVASWTVKCRQKGTFLYPAKMYRLVYLPIGLLTVIFGLVCYAFLQTRSNYYIIHSVWHVCVAVGVVFLLPNPEYME